MAAYGAAVNAGLRTLYEEFGVDIAILAVASGRSPKGVADLVKREGWRVSGGAMAVGDDGAERLEDRLVALSNRLVSELEEIGRQAAEDGTYDKGRIDALSSMLKMVEKIGEITRTPERAKENQIKNDADLAAALARIDARIIELARELAVELARDLPGGMGGAEPGPADGGAAAG